MHLQAQKEVTHAAALNRLDALVQPVVQQVGLNSPPGSPADGQSWIIGAAPTGAWAGQANRLAQRFGGAWVFHAPVVGLGVFEAAVLAQWAGTVARGRLSSGGPSCGRICRPAVAVLRVGAAFLRAQRPIGRDAGHGAGRVAQRTVWSMRQQGGFIAIVLPTASAILRGGVFVRRGTSPRDEVNDHTNRRNFAELHRLEFATVNATG